ncbi:MAG: hypothetical protein Kapaf2KO_18880 [Candidatus Kapaibacteriales bacterium]
MSYDYELDEFETFILESIENGDFVQVDDVEDEKAKIVAAVRKYRESKKFEIKVNTEVYNKISEFAKSKGMDANALASSLLQTFAQRI